MEKGEACAVCGTGVCKGCSLIALVAGILFLLQDLRIWNFWGISWYTIAFLLVGSCFILGFVRKH